MNRSQVAKFCMWTNLLVFSLEHGWCVPASRSFVSYREDSSSGLIWLHWFEGSSVLWEGVTISWSGFGWWNNLILYSGRLRQGYDLYFSVLAIRFTIQVQLTIPTLELIVNWEFRTTEWEVPLPAALLCNKVSGRRRNLSSPSDYIYGYMMMRSVLR